MIFVIVAVAVTVAMMASVVRLTVMAARQIRGSERRVQAEWLAEAGAARARIALRRNAAYSGEDWRITAAELQRDDAARVSIRVESEPETATTDEKTQTHERRLMIEAWYPAEGPLQARGVRNIKLHWTPNNTNQAPPSE